MDGHVKTDDPAVAVADDDGALDLELAHELDRVLGHVVVVERAVHRIGGPPMPLTGATTGTEARKRDPRLRDRAGPAVEQQQRWTVPVDLVVHLQPVDRA